MHSKVEKIFMIDFKFLDFKIMMIKFWSLIRDVAPQQNGLKAGKRPFRKISIMWRWTPCNQTLDDLTLTANSFVWFSFETTSTRRVGHVFSWWRYCTSQWLYGVDLQVQNACILCFNENFLDCLNKPFSIDFLYRFALIPSWKKWETEYWVQ